MSAAVDMHGRHRRSTIAVQRTSCGLDLVLSAQLAVAGPIFLHNRLLKSCGQPPVFRATAGVGHALSYMAPQSRR